MHTLLNQLVNQSGNCVNLGRTLLAKHPELYTQILNETQFLNNKPKLKFNERVYCILNNINSPVIDQFGEPARFVNLFIGYSLKEHTFNDFVKKSAIVKKVKPTKRTKLEGYLVKNKRKFKDLYLPEKVKDIDYVECPVTNCRMKSLTRKHIEQNLNMSLNEFDSLYPGARKSSTSSKLNISSGLKTIDIETGLTAKQIAVEKSKKKLSEVDENGISGYKKKGQKTRATHLDKVDEFGRNGYQRQANYRTSTVLENGLTIEQNAHLKQRDTIVNGTNSFSKASKASKKIFEPIITFLDEVQIPYHFDDKEYCIAGDENKFYFFDLTVSQFKLAIEYQSNAYHADPRLDETAWNAWKPPRGKIKSADEVLQYDYDKARTLFKKRNYVTYFIWENTKKQDVQDILCLLKTMTMKF